MRPNRSFIKSYLSKVPLSLALLLALFAGALLLFVVVAHEVLWEQEDEMDRYIFGLLQNHVINDRRTALMEGVTHFASARFLQIAYGLLFVGYLLRRNVKRSLEIAGIGLGGFVINYVMKLSFRRTRPPNPLVEPLQNFSFPSGHATSAFIFYGLLAYLIWKSNISKPAKYVAATVLVLFSILIGFSRVYLRLHYPSDVLAGFCIGFAWLLLTIYVFERLKKKADREQSGKA